MNNQEDLKTILLSLVPEELQDFIVIFSGKKSIRIDGVYHPEKKEIIIHNRNFIVWNSLVYTGIHELAHHVDFTSSGRNPVRHHDSKWKSIFFGLLNKAIEKGHYHDYFADDKSELHPFVMEIRIMDNRVAALTKDMGNKLLTLYDRCQKTGHVFEDFVSRILGKTTPEVFRIISAYGEDITAEYGSAAMDKLASKKGEERRKLESDIMDGLPGAVGGIKPAETVQADHDAEIIEIQKELNKVLKTIQRSERRREELQAMLEALGE